MQRVKRQKHFIQEHLCKPTVSSIATLKSIPQTMFPHPEILLSNDLKNMFACLRQCQQTGV